MSVINPSCVQFLLRNAIVFVSSYEALMNAPVYESFSAKQFRLHTYVIVHDDVLVTAGQFGRLS